VTLPSACAEDVDFDTQWLQHGDEQVALRQVPSMPHRHAPAEQLQRNSCDVRTASHSGNNQDRQPFLEIPAATLDLTFGSRPNRVLQNADKVGRDRFSARGKFVTLRTNNRTRACDELDTCHQYLPGIF